jgi:hypothetical protein
MATKNKRDLICTHHLHFTEGNLPASIRQSVYHTTVRNGQISWPPLRQTPHLERTCEKKTRKHLDLKTRELIWLIGKRSPLSLTNKILIYKTVLKPIWTYGPAIWGCAAASNIAIIQRYQAKTLRQITDAPRYVTNHTLHTDLRIPSVRTVFQEPAETHRTALNSHPNPLIAPILAPPNRRRLQRRWTLDVNS